MSNTTHWYISEICAPYLSQYLINSRVPAVTGWPRPPRAVPVERNGRGPQDPDV